MRAKEFIVEDHTFADTGNAWENGKKDAMNFRPKNVEKYHLRHKYRSHYSDGYNVGLKRRDRSINPETGKPYIKFGPNGPITPGQGVSEGMSWSALDEGLSVEDKIIIFEEYMTKGNLTKSLDHDKRDYFISLFKMSSTPIKDKTYIVVPLSLVGNKIMQLDAPAIMKFVGHGHDGLVFNSPNGEKTYPSKIMRDLSLFNTFTFQSQSSYDKFRTALSLKFNVSLPLVGQGKQGVAEGLDEAVGGNYLYHATSSDINVLKNIISNGLITNNSNQERTGSKLRALSFTRNWRYALTSTDDDNQGTTGIANGVIFVVDQSILKQKNKMQSVDRPADIINEFKAVLAALPTAERVNDLFQLMDGSVTPAQLAALSQIAGSSTPIMNGRSFILAVAKPYLADKTNQQALADAQSKIKQAISYFVKTSAGKSIASAGGSTGSEYEEVILTPLNYVPFKDLGVVGYMINPGVDSANQQAIRNLFAKVGVNEMPIPNSTRPGKGVAEGSESLDYQGNCTEDDVVDDIFGDVNNFANMVEKYGDEFTRGNLVVKYDPKKDVHYFYYKKQGVAEGQENFNGIDISMEIQKDDEYVDDEDYDNQVIYVTASSKGKELGHVLFAFDGEYLMPQDLEVEERYRGQGIAQTMYDYVKSKGYKIRRSGQQTDAGTGFWDKHKPGKNVWEQGVAEGTDPDEKYTIKKSYTMSKAGVEKAVWYIMDGDFVVDVTDLRRDAKYYADKWNAAEKESSNASQNPHKPAVAEGSQTECPPATQDITLNLKNRQKAIDEYGYGPLNPDMPNTKFWMKKVDEWNLDSAEEAKQSLCGNCAAFDQRQHTLDCIAQGIDSDNPEDAEGIIDAGELGYCKFLKFKCASRRTCDAWVTGGPLVDKQSDSGR